MTMKMKGLLKGLRYISTIFDEEEEAEMQIGVPTDVKHVAHIGYDGPAANNPSWIDNFKGESAAGGATNGDQQTAANPQSLTDSEGPPLESPSRRRSDKPKGKNKTEKGDTTSSKPARRKKTKGGSSSGQSSSRPSKSKAAGQSSDTQGADQTTTKRRTKGKESKDTCQGSVEDQKTSLDDISRGIQAV